LTLTTPILLLIIGSVNRAYFTYSRRLGLRRLPHAEATAGGRAREGPIALVLDGETPKAGGP
jgi:hypothetical protein